MIEQIKDQLFAVYAVGTEWYDCDQDIIGTVWGHFRPRGILLQWGSGELSRYSFSSMLDGRLIVPQPPVAGKLHPMYQYREQEERVEKDFEALVAGQVVL